ncbi:hypothetical protein [Microbulbifer sp. 2205BS26-8]|uniref:hypothetical protein n=1 Tax=Microbulbifer sp. 2205BS26-8 TaxID=3064386 RepID=UPI00273E688C|nr:hypothetical protein [Microbulbifer sp. 2205BS26-8]MDP5211335.1 hypothetical protein [Microbulbifer sp. 2205BS26-8]
MGKHNHYYACLSLSFFEIALFINGVLIAHLLLGVGELFSSVTKFAAVLISIVVFLVNYIFFSIQNRSKDFLDKKKVVLCKSSGHIGGVLSLLIPIISMFSLAYFFIER